MIRWFISHKTASTLLMFSFIILGLMAAPTLRRENTTRFYD